MRVIVAGYGSVGSAIGHALYDCGYEVVPHDPYKDLVAEGSCDVLHVCFHWDDSFVDAVNELVTKFTPNVVIVESTITPADFDELVHTWVDVLFLYSPVFGSHPNIYKNGLKKYTKFICANAADREVANSFTANYYANWPFSWRFVDALPHELIAGKVLSVNWYGMEIAFVQMIERYCNEHDLKIENVYNLLFEDMDIGSKYVYNEEIGRAIPESYMKRPIFTSGVIGGTCVMQDIEIALKNDLFDRELWNWIKKSNELKKRDETD